MVTGKHCNKEMHEVGGCKEKVYEKHEAILYGNDEFSRKVWLLCV
jgi:hypothetical protein